MNKLLFLGLLLISCKAQSVVTHEVINTEYIHTIKHDTIEIKVEVPIPIEKEINVTKEDSSYVETSVAYSFAKVDSTGLTHFIENKDIKLEVKIDTVYEYVEVEKIVEKTVDKIVEIEKKVIPWWIYIVLGGLIILYIKK